MHLLGREMKVWAKMPDESTRPLIHIDDWDFHWQGFYFYKTPVALPVGTWIEMMAAWDNSADNPRNPKQAAEARLLGRADGRRDGPRRHPRHVRRRDYFSLTATSSTSKISVAFGGITPPAPCAP